MSATVETVGCGWYVLIAKDRRRSVPDLDVTGTADAVLAWFETWRAEWDVASSTFRGATVRNVGASMTVIADVSYNGRTWTPGSLRPNGCPAREVMLRATPD